MSLTELWLRQGRFDLFEVFEQYPGLSMGEIAAGGEPMAQVCHALWRRPGGILSLQQRTGLSLDLLERITAVLCRSGIAEGNGTLTLTSRAAGLLSDERLVEDNSRLPRLGGAAGESGVTRQTDRRHTDSVPAKSRRRSADRGDRGGPGR